MRMSPKSPNHQLLGETLTRYYRLACELYNTYPIGRFTHQLSRGSLDLSLSEVDLDHLEALCHIVQNKITPLDIHIYIPALKEVGLRVIQRILQGISLCLSKSLTLTTLELDNVRLKGKNLNIFCQGLMKSKNLKTLSLKKCDLGDAGAQHVCQNIKNVPSITHLCLIDCQIGEKGASAIASLIQHQRINRDSAMWQDTLRLRRPQLDGMKGLRRITLNHNPQLNDSGAVAVASALTEDLWIKALDLQHCGIGAEGGQVLRDVLNTNQTLEILDLRQNPFVPSQLVNEVKEMLQGRHDEYGVQYMWLEPSESYAVKQAAPVKTGGSPSKYSATGVITKIKNRSTPHTQLQKTPNPPGQLGIPWRVEHRLFERREGLMPGSLVDAFPKEQQSHAIASAAYQQPEPHDSVSLLTIRKELSLYKRKYKREREKRKHVEKKLTHLQARLKDIHLLDEETVSHIEACFLKFQTFLTHLQNSGFPWQPTLFHESEARQTEINDKLQLGSSPTSSECLEETEFNALGMKVVNSQPPSSIPIPIFFKNRTYAEGGLCFPPKIVEFGNHLQTEKIVQDLVSACFALNLKASEKTDDVVPDKNDENYLKLHNDIKAGRNMLPIFSKDSKEVSGDEIVCDVMIGGNSKDIKADEKISNEANDAESKLFDEVKAPEKKFCDEMGDNTKKKLPKQEKRFERRVSSQVEDSGKTSYYEVEEAEGNLSNEINGLKTKSSNKVGDTEKRYLTEVMGTKRKIYNTPKASKKNIPLTISNQNSFEENTVKWHEKYAVNKYNARNTNKSASDEPLSYENEMVVVGWEGDINNECPASQINQEISHDDNIKNNTKEIEQIDLKLQNEQVNKELNSLVVGSNALMHLNRQAPTRYNNTVNSDHNVEAQEQSHSFKSNKTVQVKKFMNLSNTFQFRDGEMGTVGQDSQHMKAGSNTEVSETDDDKLRMQTASLLLLNRSGSASSVSITEHLSHSHSLWSKQIHRKTDKAPTVGVIKTQNSDDGMCIEYKSNIPQLALLKNEPSPVEYGSDFEVSDNEGISISSSSLASTSIPEDLLTPGEEEF
ncbi:uncharacterized protein [Procambarus clarkii]|uniref:uncharacterized protein isoform X1 n=1 Tax=Procambarus clarkii TaxID=6728 RepID=UPI0037445910